MELNNKRILTKDDLHYLACNYIVKEYLIKKGYKIGTGFPRPVYPNIVCKKDDKEYGIVVLPSVYPNHEIMTDNFRLKVVELCKQHGSIALFAPVGLKSDNEEHASKQIVVAGDDMKIFFPGFVILTDEPTQKLDVKNDEYIQL